MKYRVGDKVRIKSLDWYNENKNKYGVVDCGAFDFIYDMTKFCGCTMIVCNRNNLGVMTMGGSANYWTDDMIEGLVEEETKFGTASNPIEIKSNANCLTRERVDELTIKFNKELPFGNQNVWELPDGYQFTDEDGNVINTTKIVLEKKKKEYPKTYEECCGVLKIPNDERYIDIDVPLNYNKLLSIFTKLLICRDAYWQIAGEELGLNRPWEPDYDSGVNKYGIICMNGVVQESNPTTNWERHLNKVLDFPTAEMRDTFYENFKKLIEQCKELL